MLSKAYRLSPTESFRYAQKYSDSAFVLKSKRQELPYSRFCVVVSKKVDKRAVMRNRLRRVVHTVIQENSLFLNPGYDMLIILTPEASKIENLSVYIEKALTKILI